MILTELCRVDKALFLYPESRVPDTVICKRMAVSGTPLSPSFGTQEGKGVRSNTCGGNPHHTPHGTGTLLTLRAMTASAPCSSSRDGQQVCGCHSYGFRMVCPRRDSLKAEDSPCSRCLVLLGTLRPVRHLHTFKGEKMPCGP